MSPCPIGDSGADCVISLGRIDQFELVREIERGALGPAFQAKDTLSGAFVSVRGLPPSVKDSAELKSGVRANFEFTRSLHHPHIAEPMDVHTVQTAVYSDPETRRRLCVVPGDALLVATYAPGETLRQWRLRHPGGKVPFEKALDVVRQVASALDCAHAQRTLHCAVMPANVIVESRVDGTRAVRVVDFGLEGSFRSSLQGVSSSAYGKSEMRHYRAPEQWRGDHLHRSTDQYSLAVLFVELVTGDVPFANAFATGDPETMAKAVCSREPNLPDDCPRRDVVLRALSKDAHARFASCSEFVRALEDPSFIRTDAVAGVHHHHHEHSHGKNRRGRDSLGPRRRKALMVATVVTALAAALGWAVWSGALEAWNGLSPWAKHPRPLSSASQSPAVNSTADTAERDARLQQIQQEIERQKVVSDKALDDFRQFIATTGPMVLEVKRDEAKRALERTAQDVQAMTDMITADQNRIRALAELREAKTLSPALPGELHILSELMVAHSNFVATAGRLNGALARYTEKHPDVVALKREAADAQALFASAVESAQEIARKLLAQHCDRRAALKKDEPSQREELLRLEREALAAKTRQGELQNACARESALLSDLRRMEYSIRFGTPMPSTGSSASNAIPTAYQGPAR